MTATVFEYLILIRIDFNNFIFSVFSLVLVSIEKVYQTRKTVFDHISKHLEVRQKYSAVHRIFNSFLCV